MKLIVRLTREEITKTIFCVEVLPNDQRKVNNLPVISEHFQTVPTYCIVQYVSTSKTFGWSIFLTFYKWEICVGAPLNTHYLFCSVGFHSSSWISMAKINKRKIDEKKINEVIMVTLRIITLWMIRTMLVARSIETNSIRDWEEMSFEANNQ